MEGEKDKIIFNKEMVEKLHNISFMVMKLIYTEIEKLGLDEEEKVMAHYYVTKHYYDDVQKAMIEIGIDDVTANIKKEE